MKTLDKFSFVFGCAYAEACGKDPGDDIALLGQADKAGLRAVINAALEEAATVAEKPLAPSSYAEAYSNAIADRIRNIKL